MGRCQGKEFGYLLLGKYGANCINRFPLLGINPFSRSLVICMLIESRGWPLSELNNLWMSNFKQKMVLYYSVNLCCCWDQLLVIRLVHISKSSGVFHLQSFIRNPFLKEHEHD